MSELLTTRQTAARLGVSLRRVQSLINTGRLKAERIGTIWVIRLADLAAVKVRKPGRPRGSK